MSNQEEQYTEWVLEQLALLKDGVTLGEWKKSRSNEPIMLFNYSDVRARIFGKWCARAESRLDIGDGVEAVRYAFFYPPEAPETLVLPDEKEASDLLDRRCTLGLVWTERREASTERGRELGRSVRTAINRRFGYREIWGEISFSGVGFWVEPGQWVAGTTTLVSAYADTKSHLSEESKVLAFAFLPISTLRRFNIPPRYIYDESETMAARARRMISQSGIANHEKVLLLDVILDVVTFVEASDLGKLQQKLVEALQSWIAAAQKLDARHKAAALLAADEVLFMANFILGTAYPDEGKEARQSLNKLGAEFNYSGIVKEYYYTRTWLKQARELDPEGPAGDLAFRILMETGFKIPFEYSGDPEMFKKVIEEGEFYLRKKHDSANTATVELMVADAYRDIVAIANGAENYAAANRYQEAAATARQKAIQYYRKALARAKYTDETKFAWGEAWRLIAGLLPWGTRYLLRGD